LNTHIDGVASLLCATARSASKSIIAKLLDLGADMEIEGSEDGTALMTACASGQLEIVQLLVRRGARVQYVNEHGMSRSAVVAARHHPNIQKWLLSSRFRCQPMLTSTAFSSDHELKPIFKYKLENVEAQFWGETMIDYVIFVMRLKKSLLGRVVGL
jgi:ankyrin repeat protein